MTDGTVKVPPDSTGKNIDMSEITRPDGTVVERQRVVLSDPDDPNDLFSLDKLRFDRQAWEISMIENIEGSVNAQAAPRVHERTFGLDRRGASSGRGAIR